MDDILSNPGWDKRFTCPSCLTDFHDEEATACPSCGKTIRCHVYDQPVAVCELLDTDEIGE